jgi:hypothetical protein
MSNAAEFVRLNLLRQEAVRAQRRWRDLRLTMQFARGMGGPVPDDMLSDYWRTWEAADRLTGEWQKRNGHGDR